MSAQAYPLTWPTGWPRARGARDAPFHKRVHTGKGWSQKKQLTVADARSRLQDELDRLGARDVVLSTNQELRLDGMPRSDRAEPTDRGVAVYFKLAGKDTVLACDKWDRIADNIVAIAKHIEALRGQDRWGVGTLAQAFTGYQALPAPEQWWEALGVPAHATAAEIRFAWKSRIAAAHPDRGGTEASAARLNRARDEGLALLNG